MSIKPFKKFSIIGLGIGIILGISSKMFENSIENLIKLYALINQELLDMLHDFINEFLYFQNFFSFSFQGC